MQNSHRIFYSLSRSNPNQKGKVNENRLIDSLMITRDFDELKASMHVGNSIEGKIHKSNLK
jgi:hypothetical protein